MEPYNSPLNGNIVRCTADVGKDALMNQAENSAEVQIQRKQVASYLYLLQVLIIIAIGIWFIGAGLIAALLHAVTLGPWLTRKQSQALKYWLDKNTLRIDEGVFFLKRKAIPLDRVTDFVLVQGPLMRWCGIWGLHVQTAGTGQAIPEATLLGMTDPEGLRDRLITARDNAVAGSKKY